MLRSGKKGDKKPLSSLAEKEIKQLRFEQSMIYFFLILTVVSVVILLILLMNSHSLAGLVSYIESKAGTISEVDIYVEATSSYWAGLYGLVFMVPGFDVDIGSTYGPGEVVRQDLFFGCMQTGVTGGNEVFASVSPNVQFSQLRAATIAEVDNFMGCSGRIDCAANTFSDTSQVYVGTRLINNVPTFNTYRLYSGDRELFDVGALHDGSNLVFVTHVEEIETLFNTTVPTGKEVINFQMMLPTRGSDELYYFFSDPNDVCPYQNISRLLDTEVAGRVLDSSSNPIPGAEVILAGNTSISSANGNYEITASLPIGTHNLFARKTGYKNYFGEVTFTFDDFRIYQDIVMEEIIEGTEELGVSVSGTITSAAGTTLDGVRVYFGSATTNSSSAGKYNISTTLSPGVYTIVYVKEGYNIKSEYVNVSENNLSQVINVVMSPVAQNVEEPAPGQVDPVEQVEQTPSAAVEEIIASGEDYWISTKEINKEVMKNTFVKEEVGIYNSRSTPLRLNFELSESLKDFVKIDKVAENVDSKAFSTLIVTIYGTPPQGYYNGTLTISGDIDQEILVKIHVVDRQYPVELLFLDVETFGGIARPGANMTYKVSMKNLLRDQNYEVYLVTRLRDSRDGAIYSEDSFETEISTSKSFVREIHIPENVSNGDYILEIQADYLNFYSIDSSTVIVSRPLYLYSFFGIPVWAVLLIVSFLSFSLLNYYVYKKYRDRNKRYTIAVEQNTIPTGKEERCVKMGLIAESRKPAFYEIDKLTTHAIVSGATGMGKSVSAQVVIEESLLKGVSVIVFDPTAQWSGMLRKCTDKKMLALYSKFGLKPQDAQAFKGNVRMIKDPKQKIDIRKYNAPGQIQIFSMNKLSPAEIDIFVSNVIKQIFRSDPKESRELKTLLVFDEVHRLLPKFGGSGKGFLQIERSCREFRKWGLGVMLISQVMNDFVGEIKANINTEFQARTLEENDLNRIKTKYGEDYLKSLIKAEIGTIMFQNADYNRGRPYFVSFRPLLHSTRRLSDEELEKYNNYNDQVDDIEFQIDQLEKEKVDVFDLKMELKLIKDKIMTGSFSVVDIYLEGFTPRLKKEWEKLGKSPPKMQIELVSEEEMAEEEAKSKAEAKKAEEKKPEAAPAAKVEAAPAAAPAEEKKPETVAAPAAPVNGAMANASAPAQSPAQPAPAAAAPSAAIPIAPTASEVKPGETPAPDAKSEIKVDKIEADLANPPEEKKEEVKDEKK